jgi:hypothetical protein
MIGATLPQAGTGSRDDASLLARCISALRRFLGLALRPVPSWTGWFGIVGSLVGVTGATVLAWFLAPGTRRTMASGRAVVESASRWPWAVAVFFCLLALLFLVAGVRLQQRLASAPQLGFVEKRSRPETLNGTRPVTFAQVAVANEPGDTVGSVARHVVPYITVIGSDGAEIHPKQLARWTDKPEPAINRDLSIGNPDLTQWDEIPPNGQPFYIDTAMKFDDEDGCYVWTNEGSVKGANAIPGRSFLVEIEVRASNVAGKSVTQRFRVSHSGVGSPLVIADA